MLFIHETLLVYKLETFKHCNEAKHITIMIIAIIYIFLSYVIFDQPLKITSRKSSALPWKNPLPPLYSIPPLKFKKGKSPTFCQNWKFFMLPLQKGRERTLWGLFTTCWIFLDCQDIGEYLLLLLIKKRINSPFDETFLKFANAVLLKLILHCSIFPRFWKLMRLSLILIY